MNSPRLPRPTEMAHRLLRERLKPGDSAVDATAGNGHDTLFLAECVGKDGSVAAFDIQEQAIKQTRQRVSHLPQVTLHLDSHENLSNYLSSPVAVVTFNLGYLPSGDKDIVTKTESTLCALNESLKLLAPGGLITIVVYTGHPQGAEEGQAVEDWATELDQERFSVARYSFMNQRNTPPFLLAVEKR